MMIVVITGLILGWSGQPVIAGCLPFFCGYLLNGSQASSSCFAALCYDFVLDALTLAQRRQVGVFDGTFVYEYVL
jgi:hypothetical protein